MGTPLAVIGQMPVDHVKAAQADRYVDEENDAPMKIPDDEAAEQGPEHGSDQAGNGDEAHGRDEFGFRKGADQGDPSDGQHHGAAAARQHAEGHEPVDVARDAAEKRAERENADRRREYTPRAETVGHPAADGDEYGETQRIAREHGLHVERLYLERLRDGGDRRIENRRI